MVKWVNEFVITGLNLQQQVFRGLPWAPKAFAVGIQKLLSVSTEGKGQGKDCCHSKVRHLLSGRRAWPTNITLLEGLLSLFDATRELRCGLGDSTSELKELTCGVHCRIWNGIIRTLVKKREVDFLTYLHISHEAEALEIVTVFVIVSSWQFFIQAEMANVLCCVLCHFAVGLFSGFVLLGWLNYTFKDGFFGSWGLGENLLHDYFDITVTKIFFDLSRSSQLIPQ